MSTHRPFPIRSAVLVAALAAVVAAPSAWSVAAPAAGVAAAIPPTAIVPGPGVATVSGTAPQEAKLGTIDFPTSGSAEAQPHFIRGVLLLLSGIIVAETRSYFQRIDRADERADR